MIGHTSALSPFAQKAGGNGKLEKKVSQFLRCKLLQVILNNL